MGFRNAGGTIRSLASTSPTPGSDIHGQRHALEASESRRALSAFLLFGILTSSLGAFLPAWGYHLESHLITAGNYFLVFNVGLLIAVRAASVLVPRKGLA